MNKKPSQTLLFANQYYMLDFGTSSGGIFFGTSLLKQFSFNGSLSGGRAINFVPTDGAAPRPANRTSANLGFTLRPNTTFRMDNTYILSHFSDRATNEKVFTNHILRSRLN